MVYAMYILLMTAKNQSQFENNIYMHLIGLIWFFVKMLWVTGFLVTISNISILENNGFFFFADSAVSYVSTLNISRMVTPKPIDHNFFWKKNKKNQLNNTFQVHLNGCCHQQKNKKWAIFDTFITITLGVNDPVLLICFLNSIWYISFLHFKTFQNQFHGVLLCIVFWYNIFCSQFDTNIVSIPWTKPSKCKYFFT